MIDLSITISVAISVQAQTGAKQLTPSTGHMADSNMEGEYSRDLHGPLDFLAAATKKTRRKREIDIAKTNMEKRTTTMDPIMGAKEIGQLCKAIDTLDDFRAKQKELCGNAKGCLMCKGLEDVKDLDTFNKSYVEGMKRWIEIMKDNLEWKNASIRKKFFM
eukprot:16449655-Heterocapsa_arctica.AAC.1